MECAPPVVAPSRAATTAIASAIANTTPTASTSRCSDCPRPPPSAWSESPPGGLLNALYQINTRVWLHELGVALGRSATLADADDAVLDRIAADGFDWVWLLGVWQTGEAGRRVSLSRPEWQRQYREVLPDFAPDDVCGSPFAVREYVVNQDFGGPRALERLRKRLAERKLRLMLDFVPNHTALEHPWINERPEFYVQGTEDDLAREPDTYCRLRTRSGTRVLAHGRDPYFPGWPDTAQLNYRHAALPAAMRDVLDTIGGQCDGLRCDMAMLVLPDVFARTWGDRALPSDGTPACEDPFWPAAITGIRRGRPDFVFMAEVYWDLEWTLQQQGFDYTYDKRLYDRLRARDAGAVRGHLLADAEYQRRSVRFLENHDEPRAAATFPPQVHQAAAVLTFLVPGLHLVHEGQPAGRKVRASIHLRRRVVERADREMESFYGRLFTCMRRTDSRNGEWRLLQCQPAGDRNPTWERFIAFSWKARGRRLLVAVNYGATQGQCYVRPPWADLSGRPIVFQDLMNPSMRYERHGTDLGQQGLYLDMEPWGYHVFDVTSR
jgi:alpha amylase-like protein